MDEETQESKAEHVPLQEVEAPPVVQHSWSSLVLGSAAVFILASVTVALTTARLTTEQARLHWWAAPL